MRLVDMPVHVQSFVSELLASEIGVWLIGSQANPTSKMPADWDFIIFGSEALLKKLSDQTPIRDVDALVVYNGDEFKCPWPNPSDGVIKKGSLSGWKWEQVSDNRATYEGTKWPDDWGSTKHAIRIEI